MFPVPTLLEPESQLLQLVSPIKFWNWPCAQSIQGAVPPEPDLPAGHITSLFSVLSTAVDIKKKKSEKSSRTYIKKKKRKKRKRGGEEDVKEKTALCRAPCGRTFGAE